MDIVRKSTVLSLADQVCSPIQSQTPAAAAEIKLSSPLHCNGSAVRRPTKTALHQAVRDGRVHQARLLSASMKDIDIQVPVYICFVSHNSQTDLMIYMLREM